MIKLKNCPRDGIGRHLGFRNQGLKSHTGSSPVEGTIKNLELQSSNVKYLDFKLRLALEF